MKIRALRDYTDNKYPVENGKTVVKEIKKGDEYEVSNERGKQILNHPKELAILIEIVKKEVEILEEPKEIEKETTKEDKPKTIVKKTVQKKKVK